MQISPTVLLYSAERITRPAAETAAYDDALPSGGAAAVVGMMTTTAVVVIVATAVAGVIIATAAADIYGEPTAAARTSVYISRAVRTAARISVYVD